MKPPQLYEPTRRGLEGKIREQLNCLRELDRQAGKKREDQKP